MKTSSQQAPSWVAPVNPDKQFGLRLKELRENKGWRQERLADVAGIARTYVSELENGHKSATLGMMHALAVALGTTVTNLVKGL